MAGGQEHPFTPTALETLFKVSSGLPRRICNLCNNALIRAFSAGTHRVDAETIRQVAAEIRLTQTATQKQSPKPGRKPKRQAAQ